MSETDVREMRGGCQCQAHPLYCFGETGYFVSKHHFGWESYHPAWIDTRGLPTYRTDEHKPTVDRWMKTLGEFPD